MRSLTWNLWTETCNRAPFGRSRILAAARRLAPLLLLLLGLAVPACGGDSGDSRQGFTQCGTFTCQPGQSCQNFACIPGCQSNVNCASDQTCEDIDSGSHIGTCQNKSNPMTMPMTDSVCKTTCDKLVSCGLFTWDEGVVCQTGCEKWNSDQKKAYAACASGWDCSGTTAPVCLGPTCGGKYACAGGKQCMQHGCY